MTAGAGHHIEILLETQRLSLCSATGVLVEFPVSTARNGGGERLGSECTPRGEHVIAEKIGDGLPANTVFRERKPTGEICTPERVRRHLGRDWILTRILWLAGVEEGFNRGGDVDTYRRYIYIHGAPDGAPMGVPGSHGCIRMRNDDVIVLYERVTVGTPVRIR